MEIMGMTYYILGAVYNDLGMYNLALKNEFKALEFCKKYRSTELTNLVMMFLAGIEIKLGNYKQALIYLEEAQKELQFNDNRTGLVVSMMCQGAAFYELKEYSKALDVSKKAMSLNTDNKAIEADLWSNMGVYYLNLDKDKEAINSYWKAYKLYKDLNLEESSIYDNIGSYYSKKMNLIVLYTISIKL